MHIGGAGNKVSISRVFGTGEYNHLQFYYDSSNNLYIYKLGSSYGSRVTAFELDASVTDAITMTLESSSSVSGMTEIPCADITYLQPYSSLSGLASALGAGFFKQSLYSNGDFNNIKTNAIVSVENCSTNNPSPMKYGVLFCSFNGNTGYQLYIPNSADNYIYTRPCHNDSFYAWKQIPIGALAYLSSYTSLSALASALGDENTRFKFTIPSKTGTQYYKITPLSNKAFVYYLSGCTTQVSGTVDIELRHGGGVYEGRKLSYNTTVSNFDSTYFQYWYEGSIMYLMVGSYTGPVITAPSSFTVEEITEIPSTATRVTLDDDNGWSRRLERSSNGASYFKILAYGKAIPLKFIGSGSSNARRIDMTAVIGPGVHLAYKESGCGTDLQYFKLYYVDDSTNGTLYVNIAGVHHVRVISPVPLTGFQEVEALPEGATEIVPA